MMTCARLAWLVPAVALAFAGCSRGDPHTAPIAAPSASALGRWRMKMADRFTRDEWREFEAALQELRQRVMADREASGSAAVEEAMIARINGRTFRELLVLAYESKVARLGPIRDELQRALEGNALLVTKPGDGASSRYLQTLRERQNERVQRLDEEILSAEQRLAALGVARPKRPMTTLPGDATLTRDQALAQFRQLVREQRGMAQFKYGAWPARIDREGARLTGADRAAFAAAREASAQNGHAVIAVELQRRWWIYDAPLEAPVFSKMVTANLSPADRSEIEELWSTLQAEIWARRMAREEADKTMDSRASDAARSDVEKLSPPAVK